MDGYRQTLLGRALADALQELEQAGGSGGVDGDLLFELFDEAMRRELRDRRKRPVQAEQPPPQTFTHESVELAGRVTAFNRFMDDWNVQARVASSDIQLDHGAADLHLPRQQQGQEGQEQEVAMRLKLRKRK